MGELTHFDSDGQAWMVDVGAKELTERTAVARGKIFVSREVLKAIEEGTAKKGDVLAVARVAGIMGAKKTWELIPLCHVLMLTRCAVDFTVHREECSVEAVCTVATRGRTGVEMEALTGVQVALLTVYDMCKAMDRGMTIGEVCLMHKEGGKSGTYRREEAGYGGER